MGRTGLRTSGETVTQAEGCKAGKAVSGSDLPCDKHGIDVVSHTEPSTKKTLVVNSNITICGFAKANNADPAAAIWQLKRIITNGSIITEDYAGTGDDYGEFIFVFNDWETAFPPLPIINEKSTLHDGVNEIIDLGNDSSLDFDGTTPFSLSIWARRNGPAALDVMFAKISGTFSGYIAGASNTFAQIFLINTLGSNEIQKQFTLPAAAGTVNFHHYVFTYDGSQTAAGCKCYYDGVELTTTNVLIDALAATISNANNLGIGGPPLSPTLVPWAGNLGESSIWNVELTASEAAEIYNGGVPTDLKTHSRATTTPGSLISWYRHGDGDTFPTISDQVGSNDGTMINMEATDIVDQVP